MKPAPKRGDVWWVDFNPARGGEIHKTRPAVVVSINEANQSLNRLVVIPLTSQITKVYPSETLVTLDGDLRKAMADQILTISQERLKERIGALSSKDMTSLSRIVKLHLGL